MPSQRRHPGRRMAWSLACAATISRWTPASTSFASARVRPKSAMSTRPSGRLISATSAHDPSPSAPISTSLKTQATYPPSVRERARKYPTAVAPPISRRSLLNQVYEEDFLGFSYGFRPGRSQHDALDALMVGIRETKGVSWIIDADLQSFFDTVSHEWLIRFVEHRVGDRRIIRLIRKWLKAGVLEDGSVTGSETGTGQGSVISPLLANVYLHYVFDLWAARWRRREATGTMIITRYASRAACHLSRAGAPTSACPADSSPRR